MPDDYYSFLTGDIDLEELASRNPREWKVAQGKVFCATLGEELIRENIHSRIRDAVGKNQDCILIGGPPCQAYSMAGRSAMIGGFGSKGMRSLEQQSVVDHFYQDPRHQLYQEYLEILAVHTPAVFVMENVKGIGSAKISDMASPGSIFSNIVEGLKYPAKALNNRQTPKGGWKLNSVKYDIYSLSACSDNEIDLFGSKKAQKASDFLLKSEDYGIPQARHRVIIMGVRKGFEFVPEKLSHAASLKTVRDAIHNLPPLRSGFSKQPDSDELWVQELRRQVIDVLSSNLYAELAIEPIMNEMEAKNNLLTRGGHYLQTDKLNFTDPIFKDWFEDQRLKGVIQHQTRGHIIADLSRYMFCAAFAEAKGVSPTLDCWDGSLTGLVPKHKNIDIQEDGSLKTKAHNDRFKVQMWDKPASTVVSHISKDGHYYIHPDPAQCRSLTVREAARLQTFPDNYYFCGNRTQQFHQVGNAVPPYLAWQIAELLG